MVSHINNNIIQVDNKKSAGPPGQEGTRFDKLILMMENKSLTSNLWLAIKDKHDDYIGELRFSKEGSCHSTSCKTYMLTGLIDLVKSTMRPITWPHAQRHA